MHRFDLADERDLRRIAAPIAEGLYPGLVIALWGDLGSGKTTFARTLIGAAAGGLVEVPSPTFTLVQTYDVAAGTIWHFDLYRLGDCDEVGELGWDEAAGEGIALVEWPDRLGPLLPAERLDVAFAFSEHEGTARTMTVAGFGAAAANLAETVARRAGELRET